MHAGYRRRYGVVSSRSEPVRLFIHPTTNLLLSAICHIAFFATIPPESAATLAPQCVLSQISPKLDSLANAFCITRLNRKKCVYGLPVRNDFVF